MLSFDSKIIITNSFFCKISKLHMVGLFSSQSRLSHDSVIAQSWSRLSIFFTESTQSPAPTSTAGTTNIFCFYCRLYFTCINHVISQKFYYKKFFFNFQKNNMNELQESKKFI